jgi:hypothetical protein
MDEAPKPGNSSHRRTLHPATGSRHRPQGSRPRRRLQFMTATADRHSGNAASTLLRDLQLARVNIARLLALL